MVQDIDIMSGLGEVSVMLEPVDDCRMMYIGREREREIYYIKTLGNLPFLQLILERMALCIILLPLCHLELHLQAWSLLYHRHRVVHQNFFWLLLS